MIARTHPTIGANRQSAADNEVWIIGAVLRDPTIMHNVLDVVGPDDCLDPVAKRCLEIFVDAAKYRASIDAVVLVQEIRKRGGEAAELAFEFLRKAAEVPTASTWSYYASEVRKAADRPRGPAGAVRPAPSL